MADIGNLTGLSIRPNQDVSLADVEHQSKPAIQGALPSSIAPLATSGQYRLIGATVNNPEGVRLTEVPGRFSSATIQGHISSISRRIATPVSGSSKYQIFLSKEAAMKSILEPYSKWLGQISVELTNGRT